MKIILLLLIHFLYFTVGGNDENIKAAQRSAEYYTNNGGWRVVSPGRVSYHVSIRNKEKPDKHICSGVIINANSILTSGKCVYDGDVVKNAADLIVVAGEIELRLPIDENKYDVKSINVHEGFNGTTLMNDLAVLQSDRPFYFDEYVHPAYLPYDDIPSNPPTKVMLTAYNKISTVSALDFSKGGNY